ncbi:MAG TPA: UDP-N-acetylglucosamine 2-epimerase (non-hydrolyzing) [Catalimonadaceae bacterium]|nr:UDP-N-acetylglucosamine 2-epimerase (non-hydrolyzing) [Catalimonadaceae bacterium]
MKKILLVFGTRPEAIKMAPVYLSLLQHSDHFLVEVCITGQHKEMLDQVMEFFEIEAHYDLKVMKTNQTLTELSANILMGMKDVLAESKPDLVLVHGDTTTSTMAALSAYYAGIQVGHVEAGLRTFDKWAPFPEEMNRAITGRLTDFHFAPTQGSRNNLLQENVSDDSIIVTGNTVIDALLFSVEKVRRQTPDRCRKIQEKLDFSKPVILVTGHRRENFGQGVLNICEALLEISRSADVEIVYPVHLNPNIKGPVHELLGNQHNIHLIEPLDYESFVWLMDASYLVITDSGGVQEEAPSLGKPVLVMRDKTERPEAVEAGTVILVGTDSDKIVEETLELLRNKNRYDQMSHLHNPYGDGKAADRISKFLLKHFQLTISQSIA